MKYLIFLLLLVSCGKARKEPTELPKCPNQCVSDMLRLYKESTGLDVTTEHYQKISYICGC